MIPLYNEDKSDWITGSCRNGLDIISINTDANVFPCYCYKWVPKNLCNLLTVGNREQFWNVFKNNPVRDSIIDRSHRYCVGKFCPVLQGLYYGKDNSIFVPPSRANDFTKIRELRFQLDNSCNLICPSCRNNLIVNRDPAYILKIKNILSKIDEFFFNPLQVKSIWIDGEGEFTGNPVIVNWMLEKIDTSDVTFKLITNGTLLYKNKDSISKILSRTTSVEVSIDASNENTYSKTRVNGNWGHLLEGLALLKDMKKKYGFSFHSNYTVSSNNFNDIDKFVPFSAEYGMDWINFSRISRRTHMSNEQWANLDIFDSKHPSYHMFVESLKNLNFEFNPVIKNNFNDFLHEIVYK